MSPRIWALSRHLTRWLCSWYEFASEIFRQAGKDPVKVTPVTIDEFKSKAKRPMNIRMTKSKLAAKRL